MEGERPCWEGGRGVTLTEPAVDKTLRQIRQRRVWSLFCFPLFLLSGGIFLPGAALIFGLLSTSSFFFLSSFYETSLPQHHSSLSLYPNRKITVVIRLGCSRGNSSPPVSSLCFCFLFHFG